VRITVLGKSPAWQDAGGACSGYLIQQGDHTMLLDCGNGVFSKLRGFVDYVDVDAVLISHLHADHILDLVPFSYALLYGSRPRPAPVGVLPASEPARPTLYAPAGATDIFRRLVGCWGPADLIERAFDLQEYDAPDELAIGPLEVRFCEVPHYTRTFAVDFRSDGARMTYSADCSPNDQLVAFAGDTDMLLIEATLPCPERDGRRGHLTPGEAGDHGRRAGARRLVLTHFSDELGADWARAQAAESYGGPVELAREGAVYKV
jgi:ribonuclease BN (tRNA processing enzyme)